MNDDLVIKTHSLSSFLHSLLGNERWWCYSPQLIHLIQGNQTHVFYTVLVITRQLKPPRWWNLKSECLSSTRVSVLHLFPSSDLHSLLSVGSVDGAFLVSQLKIEWRAGGIFGSELLMRTDYTYRESHSPPSWIIRVPRGRKSPKSGPASGAGCSLESCSGPQPVKPYPQLRLKAQSLSGRERQFCQGSSAQRRRNAKETWIDHCHARQAAFVRF